MEQEEEDTEDDVSFALKSSRAQSLRKTCLAGAKHCSAVRWRQFLQLTRPLAAVANAV